MLPEMSIASASARSTSFLSWALAEKAKRRLRATRRSSLAMRRLRGRVRTIRQEPYRPSEAPASRALDSVVRAPLAFVERLPEETHGSRPSARRTKPSATRCAASSTRTLRRTCARPAARPAACSPTSTPACAGTRCWPSAAGRRRPGPTEYGGTGWSATQRYIFARECIAVDAPRIFAMGIRMVGPVIMKFGTPEQKAKYLPRIVSGDIVFCQGYSEPGSGSDLASLKTRAVRDGDDYVINGTKIWTTGAHVADHMFCLVRTATEGKPQDGISFVLIDSMDDARPHGEADRHPGRRPRGQPGVLRQRAHAGRQPHRPGECRLDGRQVPARVRARRRCLHAQPLCPHRGHQAHRPRGGVRRHRPPDRRSAPSPSGWPRPRWRSRRWR